MIHVRETIVVEGRYDINTIKQCVDANIIETSGFGIFNNAEKKKLIEILARETGIIVLTDSDGAGFVIRNYIKGIIKDGTVKHAYIPNIKGRERRKTSESKSGYLGVEGMSQEVIIDALKRCGATLSEGCVNEKGRITKQHLYFLGLSGQADSASKREKLLSFLGFPKNMSANAMLGALNVIYSPEELEDILTKVEKSL